MTVEPNTTDDAPTSRIWLINGADITVDFYLNGDEDAVETDVQATSIGPAIVIDGTVGRPFQTYTIQARAKQDQAGPILAETSVKAAPREAFDAVLHKDGSGGYRMAIYRYDFSGDSQAKVEVRQLSAAGFAGWRLAPAPEADGDGAAGEPARSGALSRRQWQQTGGLPGGEYCLEATVGGKLVGKIPQFTLEERTMRVAYLVGELRPTCRVRELRSRFLLQTVLLPDGPSDTAVTAPGSPLETADANDPLVIEFPDAEVFETNAATMPLTATDPDGYVNTLRLLSVDPPEGSAELPDSGFEPSPGIGQPAKAEIAVERDLPYGDYILTVEVNPETYADKAVVSARLKVKPITFDRLRSELSRYVTEGRLDTGLAADLEAKLNEAESLIDSGKIVDGAVTGTTITEFIKLALDNKGVAIDEQAAEDLEREALAFVSRYTFG